MRNYSKVDRNIAKYQGKDTIYIVSMMRNRQKIHENHSSLQDAIRARDEIEAVWRKTSQLKHSSLFQPLYFMEAKARYGCDDIELRRYRNQNYYTKKCKCSKCSKTLEFRLVERYRMFIHRGKICQSCQLSETVDQRCEARNKNPKANTSNLSTGIKNIYYSRRYDDYELTITRNKSRFVKRLRSLDDALRMKEHVLKFFAEYHRLPARDEI